MKAIWQDTVLAESDKTIVVEGNVAGRELQAIIQSRLMAKIIEIQLGTTQNHLMQQKKSRDTLHSGEE